LHDHRLAVHHSEPGVHGRHLLHRFRDRERDEMREAHLAVADSVEVVVQDLAVDLEQLGRDRPHRRGGRDLEAGLHVLDDSRRRPAQRRRGLTVHDRRSGRVI